MSWATFSIDICRLQQQRCQNSETAAGSQLRQHKVVNWLTASLLQNIFFFWNLRNVNIYNETL